MSEPAHTGELGIVEAMEKLLAGIRPKTNAEMRDYNFQERILPQLRMFGFEKRYCQDGLCDTKDERGTLQKRVLAKLTNVLRGRGAIVALVGPRGTGKTYIASQYVIDELWAQMDTAQAHWYHYTKLTTIVARLKAFYGDFGTTQMEQLENYRDFLTKKLRLLIIDELHEVADDSKHKDRILADLLDARYAANMDTLLISNQTQKEFSETTNPSIISRLNEHGGIIACAWKSFRESKP
jgi:DNA replication protein DnaC